MQENNFINPSLLFPYFLKLNISIPLYALYFCSMVVGFSTDFMSLTGHFLHSDVLPLRGKVVSDVLF
jgi:hypothetical protein